MASAPHDRELAYAPGRCNIGPAEIARRRAAGHVGAAATVILLVLLVAVGAPAASRLLVALPAAGAAVGYLQAYFRFCAAYGWRGVFNLGPLGKVQHVVDPAALRRDRTRALSLGVASGVIGLLVGVVAVIA